MTKASVLRATFGDLLAGGEVSDYQVESLTRVSEVRDGLANQSNWFVVAAIVMSVGYTIKVLGIPIDVKVMDAKVLDVPYANFVFLICALFAFCIGQARFMDSNTYDRLLMAMCEAYRPKGAMGLYYTFPQPNAWLSPTWTTLLRVKISTVSIWVARIFLGLCGLGLLIMSTAPILCAVHFLYEFTTVSQQGYREFQYWAVVVSLVVSVMFLISTFIHASLDVD